MKLALLGYGLETKSVEKYFSSHYQDVEIDIFDGETPAEFAKKDYSPYDIIFRSPSIPPLHLPNEQTVTRYFFDHCPRKIIGVTATKGKGTICSFIKALLDADHQDAYLVGNIGTPALDILDQLTPNSVVVYELSSFQLWDLNKSPHISVIGHLEPDHLNVHKDYQDYLTAKSHITKYQTADDYCIFYKNNQTSTEIAENTKATKIAYPFTIPSDVESAITLPGRHNKENAIAAIAAIACFKNISPSEYLSANKSAIIAGLESFHGLPHRLEFIRELNKVKYYDDNFSTNPSSTKVAIQSFPRTNLVLILGGRDKTAYQDLEEIYNLTITPSVKEVILIGESGHELARRYTDNRFRIASNLRAAVTAARYEAELLQSEYPSRETIVLMSPAAASFDMFKNVYDRGAKYKDLVMSMPVTPSTPSSSTPSSEI